MGCTKEEPLKENTIIGTWQKIKSYDSFSDTYRNINNGVKISFTHDLKHIAGYIDCETSYSINESIIEITIPCENNVVLAFNYGFDKDNNLTLSLRPPHTSCAEGCSSIYKKLLIKN